MLSVCAYSCRTDPGRVAVLQDSFSEGSPDGMEVDRVQL